METLKICDCEEPCRSWSFVYETVLTLDERRYLCENWFEYQGANNPRTELLRKVIEMPNVELDFVGLFEEIAYGLYMDSKFILALQGPLP